MNVTPDRDAAVALIEAAVATARTGDPAVLNNQIRAQAAQIIGSAVSDNGGVIDGTVTPEAFAALRSLIRRLGYIALLTGVGYARLPDDALDLAVLHLTTTINDDSFLPGA